MTSTCGNRDTGSIRASLLHIAKLAILATIALLQVPFRAVISRPRFSFKAGFADSVVWLLQSLGPPYVKFGQLLATRLPELPIEIAVRLSTIQDQVCRYGSRLTIDMISNEIGAEAASRFRFIGEKPIASGSAAVVYRGELSDGRDVAIKVIRKHGLKSTQASLDVIRRIVAIVSRLDVVTKIPLLEAFDDIAHAMTRQFDLTEEARVTQKVQGMFAKDRRVIIPRVYPELSNKNILTMNFIEGLAKVTPYTEGRAIEEAIKVGFQCQFKMILEYGMIHCDFHAGNVFFSERGVLTILDFGFAEEMTMSETYQFREFFIGVMLCDGKRCAKVLIDTAVRISDPFDRGAFEASMCQLVKSRSRVAASKFRVVSFIKELFQIQSTHGMRGSHRFTMAILSLLVFEGIAARFVPEIDFQREALPVVGPILVRRGF